MATTNCARTTGLVTLSGTTVDTVNLSGAAGTICVLNYSGAADLTVTLGVGATAGALGSAATPTAGVAESFTIPTLQSLTLSVGATIGYQTQVKILGNGNVYSVQAV